MHIAVVSWIYIYCAGCDSIHIESLEILQEVCLLAQGSLAALLCICRFLGGRLLLLAALDLALLHLHLERAHLLLIGLLLFQFLRLVDLLPHVLVDHAATIQFRIR